MEKGIEEIECKFAAVKQQHIENLAQPQSPVEVGVLQPLAHAVFTQIPGKEKVISLHGVKETHYADIGGQEQNKAKRYRVP